MESSVEQSRLIQIFLSPALTPGPAISEVSSTPTGDLQCTCSEPWSVFISCNHMRFVQTRITANKGTYPLEISPRATAEEAEKAKSSPEEFRKFVIKYGKIEVF